MESCPLAVQASNAAYRGGVPACAGRRSSIDCPSEGSLRQDRLGGAMILARQQRRTAGQEHHLLVAMAGSDSAALGGRPPLSPDALLGDHPR